MTDRSQARSPLWLRLLGGAVLLLMGVAMLYAIAIAVIRFPQIGV